MEIEMKYAVADKETADAVWEDSDISIISDLSTAESVVMKAVYFDTEDGALRNSGYTIRVRSEGERCFATLKWGGQSSDNGLHEREEINIPVSDDSFFINLDPHIFESCDIGQDFWAAIDGKPLINLLEMRFLRRRRRLSFGNSLIEMAVDNGSILTDKGDVPIMELELELFAGNTKDIETLGAKLTKKYNLIPKKTSKFKDGLKMLNS